MRVSILSLCLFFVLINNNIRPHLVEASKLRRGSVKQNQDIDDVSTSDERYLLSLTDAEALALKKTPPEPLKSSKCGLFQSGDETTTVQTASMLRKQHPGCTRHDNNNNDPWVTATLPPISPPTKSPPPTISLPTTAMPTMSPTRPLNCIQTVAGIQLTVPMNEEFKKEELHCLVSDDGGKVAYFGYTSSNEFGLFVNSQKICTIPKAMDRFGLWSFQMDGNLVIRDVNRSNIWRSETPGNFGSRLIITFTKVLIETNAGATVWFQPPYPVTMMPSIPSPPTSYPTATKSQADPTQSPTAPLQTNTPATPFPTTSPPTDAPTPHPTTFLPTMAPSSQVVMTTPPPTILQPSGLTCVQTVTGDELTIPVDTQYRQGQVHCLISADGQAAYFGHTWTNEFGLFANAQAVWTVPQNLLNDLDRWNFQDDGNLVLRDSKGQSVWTTGTYGNYRSLLRISLEHVWIERRTGLTLWSQPPYLGPPRPVPHDGYPDPNGALQFYAYYYPWYHRNDWSRHGYQDEPLLGKYGTNEIAVAEQHIQWALETGITSWVVSWWGPGSLAMKHFKAGMLNAPSIDQIKFCMLYESPILDNKGSWRDGSKEELMYQHLKVIRDEFFDHPSYLKINGRPVLIIYVTRSRMMFQDGFDGPTVLANMRRRLGYDIYFIADEPFYDPYNKSPEGTENAFKNGKQVFDAYTTYNMFVDSKVRDGETATDFQLREGMPIWKRWSEKVPFFPNVMAQYYDFRGHKPLLGTADDFMRQLREVACLPRTNFNGAPHIMFITSFNEWWEGTQIEPEDGSKGNWNNYGFQFMETLATFKKEVDSRGTYWCN